MPTIGASLRERVELLRRVLPGEIDLHYAIKANPMPALVGHMAQLVDGLDVASGAELRVALDAGMDSTRHQLRGARKIGGRTARRRSHRAS